MTNKPGAVITGGDFQGLGLIRALARKSIPVIVLDSDHFISRYSRFKKKFVKSPPPSQEESYVNFLIKLAKKENIQGWVIFPNSDEAIYVLSKYRNTLSEFYRVTTPPWEVIENVYIKEKTYQLAEKHGIPIPKTYYPKSLSELMKLDLQFPVVMKPSIRDHFYSRVKIKAFKIKDRDDLLKTYRRVCSIIYPSDILIQEFISGGPLHLYSFCPFFKEGQVITSIMARRARQHPMDFGHASTFAELVNYPEMQELGERFLRLINFYGIGEVEFMQDPQNGEFKLIEVNPRVWGWHTLAIAAGINLPYLLYQDMIGEEIEVPTSPRQVKWVRLTTDIPTVFLEIVKGKMSIRDYIASMRGKKTDAVLSLSDPLPFLAEAALIPYLWVKRGL